MAVTFKYITITAGIRLITLCSIFLPLIIVSTSDITSSFCCIICAVFFITAIKSPPLLLAYLNISAKYMISSTLLSSAKSSNISSRFSFCPSLITISLNFTTISESSPYIRVSSSTACPNAFSIEYPTFKANDTAIIPSLNFFLKFFLS